MTPPSWTKSLRVRITFWSALVTAAILIIAAVSMTVIQRRQLIGATDDVLEEAFTDIRASVETAQRSQLARLPRDDERVESGGIVARRLAFIAELATSSERSVQVLDASGNVIATSSGLSRLDDPLVDVDDGDQVNLRPTNFEYIPLQAAPHTVTADDERFRVIVGAYYLNDEIRYVVLAERLRDVDQAIAVQAGALLVSIPALIALLAGLIWVVTGRALKPVGAIQREVETISGDDLYRRVPVPTSSLEIEHLATTMNHMLDRLDQSAETQRRFVDDASHELRSPIAGVRGLLEVNLAHPEVADWAESGQEMLGETIRMQHLVDDLMTLARGTAANGRRSTVLLDLDDIVLAEGARLSRDSELTINLSSVSAAQVVGNIGELTRVVRNLADNAMRHASSTISLSLAEVGDTVELTVEDDGPGVEPSMAERIFERFARLDEARARDEGGSGLGLAIVKAIVERHDGVITLGRSRLGGAKFLVVLPSDSVRETREIYGAATL